jgi:peptidyl-tRNA hydrolase
MGPVRQHRHNQGAYFQIDPLANAESFRLPARSSSGCERSLRSTVERLTPIHQAQVLTYLRLSGKEVGLLLNFWACPLKDGGIQRLVLSRDRA